MREDSRSQGKRLLIGEAQPGDLDHSAGCGQVETSGNFLLVFDDLGHQHAGTRRQSAAGHMFRVAHELVEVNFGCSYEGASAAPSFDNAFALEPRERVAGSHQADLVGLG